MICSIRFASMRSERGIVHLPCPTYGMFRGLSHTGTILWSDGIVMSVSSQFDQVFIRRLCTYILSTLDIEYMLVVVKVNTLVSGFLCLHTSWASIDSLKALSASTAAKSS